MSSRELLSVEPKNLEFPFELKKHISCIMTLTNNSDSYIAFKVKVTSLYNYCVKPNPGILLPHSSLYVSVRMQAQKKAPAYIECKDNIVIQSVFTTPDTTIKDINYMFKKKSRDIFKKELKVSYVSPPHLPSVAQEGSNEGDLLSVHPQELQFSFELNKHISCKLQLTNKIDSYVAFKVYTTNPKKYCVLPNHGIVLPRSTYDIIVEVEAQKESPTNMECKDSFLIQSTLTTSKDIASDIKSNMFNKESGNVVGECELKVSYISPSQPPPVAQDGSNEGVSVSVSGDGNLRIDSTKKPAIYQFSDVSPPQLRSAAEERSNEGGFVSDNGYLRSDSIMHPGELLSVQPPELQFRFKSNKEMFCTIKLTNNTDSHIAFMVNTTNTKKYFVRPYIGIVMPLSARYLLVMKQALEEAPTIMECKDTFLLLSVITSPETTNDNINFDMFNDKSGNVVYEQKLKVRYVSPSQTLSAALHKRDLLKVPRPYDVESENKLKSAWDDRIHHSPSYRWSHATPVPTWNLGCTCKEENGIGKTRSLQLRLRLTKVVTKIFGLFFFMLGRFAWCIFLTLSIIVHLRPPFLFLLVFLFLSLLLLDDYTIQNVISFAF